MALVALGGSQRARAAGVVTTCDEAHLNTALSGGGLVTFTCGPATITVTSTKTISTDTTIDGGGLITLQNSGSASFAVNSSAHFTVQHLTLSGSGDGIDSSGGAVTATDCTFTGNSEGISTNGPVIAIDCTFTGNSGDGISSGNGTVTVTDCTFANNGSIGISSGSGTVTATNCAFVNNTDDGISGGGPVIAANCTFANNGNDGISGGGTTTVTNCTFANNGYDGISTGGTTTFTNTILANNASGNCSGTVTDGGHNLDDDGSCSFASGTTNSQLDPAGLKNNGGPTQTIALCTGAGTPAGCTAKSPAIDAADNTTCTSAPVSGVDQRGFTRFPPGDPVCDIGAFEAGSSGPPPAAPAPAPALSPVGLVALGLLLCALGSGAVRRRN
jgi:hypothetical protein